MRRGFKAEAERVAASVRSELGLGLRDRLDPMLLANHLSIPVVGVLELASKFPVGNFHRYFSAVDPDSFSAITIFRGYHRLIVHNDAHHPNRQASNLAHELSHTLLEHEPAPLADPGGHRFWNAEVEEEATWLGAALLLPRDAAFAMVKTGLTTPDVAAHFGVSEDLCQWRIRQTGVLLQLQRGTRWSGARRRRPSTR